MRAKKFYFSCFVCRNTFRKLQTYWVKNQFVVHKFQFGTKIKKSLKIQRENSNISFLQDYFWRENSNYVIGSFHQKSGFFFGQKFDFCPSVKSFTDKKDFQMQVISAAALRKLFFCLSVILRKIQHNPIDFDYKGKNMRGRKCGDWERKSRRRKGFLYFYSKMSHSITLLAKRATFEFYAFFNLFGPSKIISDLRNCVYIVNCVIK